VEYWWSAGSGSLWCAVNGFLSTISYLVGETMSDLPVLKEDTGKDSVALRALDGTHGSFFCIVFEVSPVS
jgi:hypothetical protein